MKNYQSGREKKSASPGKISHIQHKFKPRSTPPGSKYKAPPTREVMIRLNKFIANAGICSRREADQLIESGAISINGQVVTQLGTRIHSTDQVKFNDRIIRGEKPVYILLNKPKGYITTLKDQENRPTIVDLVRDACRERIYPVGRLDRNSTGLILLTNDGELAEKLAHPSYRIRKIYEVGIDQPLRAADLKKLREGLTLEDGFIKADEIAIVSPDKQKIGIEIHSGRNRIIRRMLESLGYKVTKLDRVMYAGLTKKDLPRGRWRFLDQREIVFLKHLNA